MPNGVRGRGTTARGIGDALAAGLDDAADGGLLWLAVASLLAGHPGPRRRAAMRGVLAMGLAAGALAPLRACRRRSALRVAAEDRRFGADAATHGRFRTQTTITGPGDAVPSTRSAAAAAFTAAVALESPRVAVVIAPLAAGVVWSRWWTSLSSAGRRLVSGALVGVGVALATRRWWPVRTVGEAHARPLDSAPPLPGGQGLLIVANSLSGPPGTDPVADVAAALPHARVLTVREGEDLAETLDAAIDTRVQALGVAGGDGTVVATASVALRHRLPLVVVPAGTLNHFARDVGVRDLDDAVAAARAGEAVAVGLATVVAQPGGRTHHFLNTASIGSYPELVRLRESWESRYGKWPAFAAALAVVLGRSERIRVRLDGRWQSVWFVFVGNGPYRPRGMVPAERPVLDSGLLDVRWLRADVRFSRLRVLGALLLGALGHSHVYREARVAELHVELREPGALACDGEVVEEAGHYTFRVLPQPVPVYRRNGR